MLQFRKYFANVFARAAAALENNEESGVFKSLIKGGGHKNGEIFKSRSSEISILLLVKRGSLLISLYTIHFFLLFCVTCPQELFSKNKKNQQIPRRKKTLNILLMSTWSSGKRYIFRNTII